LGHTLRPKGIDAFFTRERVDKSVRQDNAVVLWIVFGVALSLVVLVAAQPWWLVPLGMFCLMLLSPFYVR
jgi:hypothetical protein